MENTFSPPNWACSVCAEDFESFSATYIDHEPLCKSCIQKLFQRAYDQEINYPAQWQHRDLLVRHCDHVLSEEFIAKYEMRMEEYDCPIAERIYCEHPVRRGDAFADLTPVVLDTPLLFTAARKSKPSSETEEAIARIEDAVGGRSIIPTCGNFIGRRADANQSQTILSRCTSCRGFLCMTCGKVFVSESARHTRHSCASVVAIKEKAKAEAFGGLERGKAWQQCPNAKCKQRLELQAACNHMTCAWCKAGFCFICGEEAADGSGHWNIGGCPRYKHPDDWNPGFDDGDNDEQEDVEPGNATSEMAGEELNGEEAENGVEEEEVRQEQGGWRLGPAAVDGLALEADAMEEDELLWQIFQLELNNNPPVAETPPVAEIIVANDLPVVENDPATDAEHAEPGETGELPWDGGESGVGNEW